MAVTAAATVTVIRPATIFHHYNCPTPTQINLVESYGHCRYTIVVEVELEARVER